MAKRKRASRPQSNSLLDTNNLDTAAKLTEANRLNLELLETWGRQADTLRGVPVCLAFGYDLIQYLNVLTMQELLPAGDVVDDPAA